MASRARIEKAYAKMAELKPHLVGKVQTGQRGQLVLFPGHMSQLESHAWRYQGTDPKFRTERHYTCSICGELMIKVGEALLYGLNRSTEPTTCKGKR